tara:strand:+ start:84 stop:725 length:642 start_codon:yes stop_codon:yes gene_type:complete
MKTFTVTNSQYVNKKDNLQLFNTGVGKWFDIEILDAGINWHMWYKPLVLLTHVANLPDDELVLYCDAMDVTINAYPHEIIQEYTTYFEGKVVFNAETNPTNWTNMPKLVYEPHTLGDLERKYINAGVFMGRAKPLMEVLRQWTATFREAKEFFNAGATGCDQAPLVITWNKNPSLPIVVDSFERIMAVYPAEDAEWIADSVMIRHDQNLKKAK